MSHVDFWAYERPYIQAGTGAICGIDEAGRGPLAGPVCAAAVILPPELDVDAVLPGLNDSKRLTDNPPDADGEDLRLRRGLSCGFRHGKGN